MVAEKTNLPPPKPPFTDFRYEKPGQVRKITLKDLPAPFTTGSAGNGPQVVARPEGAWPQVPDGFKVEQYAAGLDNPRIIRTAPNGDFFLAETNGGDIKVFRGITADGQPEQVQVFATTHSLEAVDAIAHSDQILVGPGSLYTSLLAVTVVPEIRLALALARGRIVQVGNLRTESPETAGLEFPGLHP